jgi:hypothetical protein
VFGAPVHQLANYLAQPLHRKRPKRATHQQSFQPGAAWPGATVSTLTLHGARQPVLSTFEFGEFLSINFLKIKITIICSIFF